MPRTATPREHAAKDDDFAEQRVNDVRRGASCGIRDEGRKRLERMVRPDGHPPFARHRRPVGFAAEDRLETRARRHRLVGLSQEPHVRADTGHVLADCLNSPLRRHDSFEVPIGNLQQSPPCAVANVVRMSGGRALTS